MTVGSRRLDRAGLVVNRPCLRHCRRRTRRCILRNDPGALSHVWFGVPCRIPRMRLSLVLESLVRSYCTTVVQRRGHCKTDLLRGLIHVQVESDGRFWHLFRGGHQVLPHAVHGSNQSVMFSTSRVVGHCSCGNAKIDAYHYLTKRSNSGLGRCGRDIRRDCSVHVIGNRNFVSGSKAELDSPILKWLGWTPTMDDCCDNGGRSLAAIRGCLGQRSEAIPRRSRAFLLD